MNDFSKILLYLLIGWMVNKVYLVLGFLTVMITLRPVIGGLHRKTYWGCFFYTLVMLVIAFLISKLSVIYLVYVEYFSLAICLAGTVLSPVVSPKKRPQSKAERVRKRIIALFIQSLLLILYMINRREVYGDGLLAGLIIEHGQITYISLYQHSKSYKGEASHGRNLNSVRRSSRQNGRLDL